MVLTIKRLLALAGLLLGLAAAHAAPVTTQVPQALYTSACASGVPLIGGGGASPTNCMALTGYLFGNGAGVAPTASSTIPWANVASVIVTNAQLQNPSTTVNGVTCTLGSTCSPTATATSLTIGTTTVLTGTTTRVLFDNAGVVGEYTISGTGNVAMTTSPTFVTPALGTPASGVLTNATGYPSQSLVAIVSGSAPATGKVGQVLACDLLVGSGVSLSGSVAADVCSIPLTAGAWRCDGNVAFSLSGATTTSFAGWISLTSATVPTAPNSGAYFSEALALTTTSTTQVNSIASFYVNTAVTPSVFLTGFSSFSAGTIKGFGHMNCQRIA